MLGNKNSSEDNRPKREGQGHHAHDHTHTALDPVILTTQRGIWAIKWSFLGLFVTALLQVIVVLFSGSVALLADTIHNFGDAATSIPLWIAFAMARWKPSQKFTYGYGRVEDLAGVTIVLVILFSACITGYESINRLFHPQKVEYLWAVAAASVIGFLGNELVAMLRIKVGKEIGSAALIADGYHARVDGLTSLAVLVGATGVWLGYPLADPIVGLLISIAILRICWVSIKAVFTRFLDGVDHKVIYEITHTAKHTAGVHEVTEVRARWVGHRLHAEVNVAVSPEISVEEGHEIAKEVRHQLLHFLPHLSNATIHIDPANALGEKYHRIPEHIHDDLPPHSH
ncbi:MAG: cation efflux family protein [candidate division Zixibacteria bacterium RBG-1]|nr:MAG: cation efflux family protein [candidate division Zixibacteria bacterium RBG-1]OGC86360.1 MAG: cation transporter [candidate division Zixibacteria bacterium RBG_19FT_COMBO_42_43]